MQDRGEFTCASAQAELNRLLDGTALQNADRYAEHRRQCAPCRSSHRAGVRLLAGLAKLEKPRVAEDLASRTLQAVLRDRRAASGGPGSGRSWRMALATAASIFVAGLALFLWGAGSRTVPVTVERLQRTSTAPAVVSKPKLIERIGEAGSAIVTRTRKAGETIPSINLSGIFSNPAPPAPEKVLTTFGELSASASSGFQPVASSAKRAFNLFVREMPIPAGDQNKPKS